MAGTSMAAPAVSAVAALIKQANPGISLGALKTKIQKSADDEGKKGNDPFYGKGFINARKAVSR
jgi:subtilisin family serine protease